MMIQAIYCCFVTNDVYLQDGFPSTFSLPQSQSPSAVADETYEGQRREFQSISIRSTARLLFAEQCRKRFLLKENQNTFNTPHNIPNFTLTHNILRCESFRQMDHVQEKSVRHLLHSLLKRFGIDGFKRTITSRFEQEGSIFMCWSKGVCCRNCY